MSLLSRQVLIGIIILQSFVVQCVKADCSINTYGQNCSSACSPTCLATTNNYRLCDESDGSCFSCLPGYQGQFCEQQCTATTFGIDCNHQCNTNCRDQLCDRVIGICDSCIDGKEGFFCEVDQSDSINNENGTDRLVWIVVGAVSAAVVVACILVVVIFIWRRRQRRQTQAKSSTPRSGVGSNIVYNPQYRDELDGTQQTPSPNPGLQIASPGQVNFGESSDFNDITDVTETTPVPAPLTIRPSTSRTRQYDHVVWQGQPIEAPSVYHDLDNYDYPEFIPVTDGYDYPGQRLQLDISHAEADNDQSNRPSSSGVYHQPNRSPSSGIYHQPDRPPSSGVYHQPDRQPSSGDYHQQDSPLSSCVYHQPHRRPSSGVYHQPDRSPSSGVYHQPDRSPSSGVYHQPDSRPSSADHQHLEHSPSSGVYHQPDFLRTSGVPNEQESPHQV